MERECDCTRERAANLLRLLSNAELMEMAEDAVTEIVCPYCGEKYLFTAKEVLALRGNFTW